MNFDMNFEMKFKMGFKTIEKIAGKLGSLLLIAALIPFMALAQSDKDKDKDKDKGKKGQTQGESRGSKDNKGGKPSNSGQSNTRNTQGATGSTGKGNTSRTATPNNQTPKNGGNNPNNSPNATNPNTGVHPNQTPNNPRPNNPPSMSNPNSTNGRPNQPSTTIPPANNPPNGNGGFNRENRGNGSNPPNSNSPKQPNVVGGGGAGRANANAGINGHWGPPSNAAVSRRPDGSATHTTTDGRTWQTDRTGNVTHFSKPGVEANFNRGGRVTYVHDTVRNVTVTRTVTNVRTVEMVRPGGVRVVSVGARVGFVERPWGPRPGFVERTYVNGGASYTRVYRTYNYRNVAYVAFVPRVYYSPGFYRWGYSPWRAGVSFRFGWYGSPWFGFYGGYFAPYPVYAGPAFWLTDYIIAANLQAAYEARMDARASAEAAQASADAAADAADAAQYSQQQGDVAPTQLSPEIKQAIADEVQRQLQAQQAAAANPQNGGADQQGGDMSQNQVPAALDPNVRIFVVSSPLSVSVNDQPCELTAGDVVTRIDDTPDDGGSVRVSVVSSKETSCHAGAMPHLQVTDLQEMHNDFQAQVERGMGDLAKGQNGLPPAPAPNPQTTSAGQATADPNAAQMLKQAQQAGAQTETDAQTSAQAQSGVIDH